MFTIARSICDEIFNYVYTYVYVYIFLNLYRRVKITYKNMQRPITNINEAITHPERVLNFDGPPFNQGEHIGDIEGS